MTGDLFKLICNFRGQVPLSDSPIYKTPPVPSFTSIPLLDSLTPPLPPSIYWLTAKSWPPASVALRDVGHLDVVSLKPWVVVGHLTKVQVQRFAAVQSENCKADKIPLKTL